MAPTDRAAGWVARVAVGAAGFVTTAHWQRGMETAQARRLAGDDILHLDIRNDNLCFTPDRTILVDWNWACVGNGEFDLASWLPSLHSEGGPPPESLLPDAPEMAAALSGFWAARAGLPRPEARQTVLMSQLRAALPWAARALGLAREPEWAAGR